MAEVELGWLWVPCGKCGALVGMDCVTITGRPRDAPHGQRWDTYAAIPLTSSVSTFPTSLEATPT